MKFLISIVGKPSGYRNVKYVYKGVEKESKFSSSLVKEMEKPDVNVLIGQFTHRISSRFSFSVILLKWRKALSPSSLHFYLSLAF